MLDDVDPQGGSVNSGGEAAKAQDQRRESSKDEAESEATDRSDKTREAGSPTDPAALAKQAMERARASARERGARRTSPQTARRERGSRRAATNGESSPQPFGLGRDPKAMSENVQAFLSRMGWTEHIEVASVTARWRDVIGDQIADHCDPVSFDDGVLTLRASSSAWATQMHLMSGQVRHRLNEEFGREVVKELRFLGPSDKNWIKGPRRVKGRGPRDTYG